MRTINRFTGVLRVALLMLAFSLVSGLWLRHRAHAYAERVLLRVGDHMLRYAGAHHQTAPEQITVNGATFFLSTGSVQASVPDVLDHFQDKCQSANGRLHEQWAHVSKQRHVQLGNYASILDGVFRTESEHAGIVVCAETGRDSLPPELLIARIRAVLATGDIAKLGKLRYVYVTQDDPQAAFVALWSEGELNFRKMFPAHGDAPGADLPGVPRPPGSRRVLSTKPVGADAALNMYTTKERADALASFYGDGLPKAGYSLLTEKRRFMAADNGERMLTISLQDDGRTGHGIATIATQPD